MIGVVADKAYTANILGIMDTQNRFSGGGIENLQIDQATI
jgi:hypothetical protein